MIQKIYVKIKEYNITKKKYLLCNKNKNKLQRYINTSIYYILSKKFSIKIISN